MERTLAQLPVISLIPQRPPMVMISSVVSADTGKLASRFLIGADCLFVDGENLTESGMLENIAQTAAAMVGLACLEKNVPVPLGFIGGINKIKVHQLPSVGQELYTEVEILQEVMHITLIQGKCFCEGGLLLECHMKIVINP